MKAITLIAVLLLVVSLVASQDIQEVKGCEICKVLVGALQSELKNYEGKITDAIKQGVCTKFGDLSSSCDAFVDQYGKPALDLLVQQLDPEAVCHKLSLCDNAEWFKKIFPAEQATKVIELALKAQNSQYCDICKYVVNEAEQYLNQSEPDVEKALVKACSYLPTQFQSLCDMVVLTYGHQIIEMMIKYGNGTVVCQKLGLCDAATVVIEAPKAQELDKCAICEFVVAAAEKFIAGKVSEEKIQKGLENACELTGKYADQCKALVDQYLPYILHYITEKYPADQICKLVELCTAKKADPTVESKEEAVPKCAVCQWIIHEVENLADKQNITKALDKVCNIIPGAFRGQCIDLVNQYGPIIIKMIEEMATPEAICKAIGMCDKKTETMETKVEEIVKSGDGYCDLCKQVAEYLEDLIKSNATSQEIIAALQKVCDIVPTQYKDQCKVVIPMVWQQIVQKLVEKETPDALCKQLHFCPQKDVKPISQPVTVKSLDGGVCAGCKQVVAVLDNFISSNTTESQIIAAVEQVCQYFPSQYQDFCKAVVDQYGPQIVELLVERVLQPETVCKAVHACSEEKPQQQHMDPAMKLVKMANPAQRIRLN